MLGVKIGYARVSTGDQTTAPQLDALRAAGCERIFQDDPGGAKNDRPGLAEALAFARPGDVLVIWGLDRLGRSIRHLIDLAAELKEREIGLSSLREAIDTTTASGKMLFHVMGALAEFERDRLLERTMAGLAAARDRGRTGGRQPLDPGKQEIIRRTAADPDADVSATCKALGISRTTFYRYAKSGEEVAPPVSKASSAAPTAPRREKNSRNLGEQLAHGAPGAQGNAGGKGERAKKSRPGGGAAKVG